MYKESIHRASGRAREAASDEVESLKDKYGQEVIDELLKAYARGDQPTPEQQQILSEIKEAEQGPSH